jgi:hypothetical protein
MTQAYLCIAISVTALTLVFFGQFHKPFTLVTYSLSKIRCTIHCMHFPIKCFQNALTYFAMAVIYGRKMLMKLPPGTDVIKLFRAISYEFRNKLECLSLSSL